MEIVKPIRDPTLSSSKSTPSRFAAVASKVASNTRSLRRQKNNTMTSIVDAAASEPPDQTMSVSGGTTTASPDRDTCAQREESLADDVKGANDKGECHSNGTKKKSVGGEEEEEETGKKHIGEDRDKKINRVRSREDRPHSNGTAFGGGQDIPLNLTHPPFKLSSPPSPSPPPIDGEEGGGESIELFLRHDRGIV